MSGLYNTVAIYRACEQCTHTPSHMHTCTHACFCLHSIGVCVARDVKQTFHHTHTHIHVVSPTPSRCHSGLITHARVLHVPAL